jgi:hypothetical protein
VKLWRRLPIALVAIALTMGVVPASATTVPPAPPGPTATIIKSDWSVGDKMIVRGTNWPEGKVNVQVCGNAAVNGTNDCDGPGTRGFGVGKNHSFSGRIIVGAPPAPCPCVVLVGTNFDEQTVLIPITIKDHPVLDGTPKADPNAGLTTLSLTSSFVRGDWWRDAVGISPARIMTITITNTGGRPTGAGVVDITVGKESPPTGFAASISFESIDPGESTSVAAKFAVDSFAYGTYNMTARVTSPAAGGEITEQTSTFPGYLLVLLILIVLIVDLIWMARVRRRRHMFAAAEAAAAAARANAAATSAAAEADAAATAKARADAEELAAREAAEALIALLASEPADASEGDSQPATPAEVEVSTPPVKTPTDAPVATSGDATVGETTAEPAATADAAKPADEPKLADATKSADVVKPAEDAKPADATKRDADQKSTTIDDYFDSLLGERP